MFGFLEETGSNNNKLDRIIEGFNGVAAARPRFTFRSIATFRHVVVPFGCLEIGKLNFKAMAHC